MSVIHKECLRHVKKKEYFERKCNVMITQKDLWETLKALGLLNSAS